MKKLFLLWTNSTACTGVSENFFWTEEKKPIAFWYCKRFLESRVIFDA